MPTASSMNVPFPLHGNKCDDVPARDLHRIQQTGNASAHDLYGLTQEAFASLLMDSATAENCEKQAAALSSLKENILNTGNKAIRDNCIDLLHNIALRNDVPGYRAEKMLAKLFGQSSDSEINKVISEQIAATSLELVTMRQSNPRWIDLEDACRLNQPSALLCMALSHPTATGITKEIQEDIINTLESQETAAGLWSEGRFIPGSELEVSGEEMNRKYKTINVNLPKPLINPYVNDLSEKNILSALLRNKQQDNKLNQLDRAVELFTLNTMVMKENEQGLLIPTKEHWVLVALYRESPQSAIKMTVFSSLPLDENDRIPFTDSLTALPGLCESITFIDDDLQKDVPNGCGLFTDRLIEYIGEETSQGSNRDITGIIRTFAADMKKCPPDELKQFNIVRRSKLLTDKYLNRNKP